MNRAIEQAGRAGAISSATLMANSLAFDEAVRIARNLPRLSVGCHIVLVDGEPLSRGLSSLTGGGSRFKGSLKDFAVAATRKRLSQDEIQREAEAQIRKIQSAGIAVSHVDTHKHTHIFPHVLHPVLRAAKNCGVHAVRNPFEPVKAWPKATIAARPTLWKRALQVGLLQKFFTEFRRSVSTQGMFTSDGVAGVVATGRMDQELLLATINALPKGVWELVCHPGYIDAGLSSTGTRLLQSRTVELEVLLSQQTRTALAKRGIELVSYKELLAQS